MRPRHILPVVVVAQFAGTSVWFATNAVIGEPWSLASVPIIGSFNHPGYFSQVSASATLPLEVEFEECEGPSPCRPHGLNPF